MNNSEAPKEFGKKVGEIISKTFTPTGNFTEDKARGEAYAKAVGMDPTNTEMAVVAATQGLEAAAKEMLKTTGGDYMAMRQMFG